MHLDLGDPIQFIPEVAKVASEVTIFQRTPPWIRPTEDYHRDVPDGKHWLLNHVPFYAKWYRFLMFWLTAEGMLAAVKRDPAWSTGGRFTARYRAATGGRVIACITGRAFITAEAAIVRQDGDPFGDGLPDGRRGT